MAEGGQVTSRFSFSRVFWVSGIPLEWDKDDLTDAILKAADLRVDHCELLKRTKKDKRYHLEFLMAFSDIDVERKFVAFVAQSPTIPISPFRHFRIISHCFNAVINQMLGFKMEMTNSLSITKAATALNGYYSRGSSASSTQAGCSRSSCANVTGKSSSSSAGGGLESGLLPGVYWVSGFPLNWGEDQLVNHLRERFDISVSILGLLFTEKYGYCPTRDLCIGIQDPKQEELFWTIITKDPMFALTRGVKVKVTNNDLTGGCNKLLRIKQTILIERKCRNEKLSQLAKMNEWPTLEEARSGTRSTRTSGSSAAITTSTTDESSPSLSSTLPIYEPAREQTVDSCDRRCYFPLFPIIWDNDTSDCCNALRPIHVRGLHPSLNILQILELLEQQFGEIRFIRSFNREYTLTKCGAEQKFEVNQEEAAVLFKSLSSQISCLTTYNNVDCFPPIYYSDGKTRHISFEIMTSPIVEKVEVDYLWEEHVNRQLTMGGGGIGIPYHERRNFIREEHTKLTLNMEMATTLAFSGWKWNMTREYILDSQSDWMRKVARQIDASGSA